MGASGASNQIKVRGRRNLNSEVVVWSRLQRSVPNLTGKPTDPEITRSEGFQGLCCERDLVPILELILCLTFKGDKAAIPFVLSHRRIILRFDDDRFVHGEEIAVPISSDFCQ